MIVIVIVLFAITVLVIMVIVVMRVIVVIIMFVRMLEASGPKAPEQNPLELKALELGLGSKTLGV